MFTFCKEMMDYDDSDDNDNYDDSDDNFCEFPKVLTFMFAFCNVTLRFKCLQSCRITPTNNWIYILSWSITIFPLCQSMSIDNFVNKTPGNQVLPGEIFFPVLEEM